MLSGGRPGFDSHAHLHFSHFDEDLCNVILRARNAGISDVMIPSIDLPSAIRSAEIAREHSFWSASAFHPEHLPETDPDEHWREIRKTLLSPRVVAVGETGLDFHHKTFPAKTQTEWFHRHIHLAESIGYPLIVHSRSAEEAVLHELPDRISVPVVLHSWGGGRQLTASAVSRGFYIGVGGPLTYRKNSELRGVIAGIPAEQLLVETDSPFLPPEPFRGRRNEPSHARMVVERIRELRGCDMSIEGTSFLLWNNAMRAFLLHPADRRAEIAYSYNDSLYVNLTSECQNSCTFCIRRSCDGIGDHFLRHRRDPHAELVLSTLEALPVQDYSELVFCGFGEPTLRSDLLVKCARLASVRGLKTRLNTNGLCTSFMDDESTAALLGSVDSVSISLNASGSDEYNRICPSSVNDAWDHLLKFIRLVKTSGIRARVTAVKGSGADLHRVARLAERLDIPLKLREQ